MTKIKYYSLYSFLIIFLVVITSNKVYAERGCCSRHGGVCGCNGSGRQTCCDGSTSPSCQCTPPTIYGCTDYKADNYNRDANNDDGSCIYTIKGCTDSSAINYNSSATSDDGSCKYEVLGCTDRNATNYNYNATKDDGSCIYNNKEKYENINQNSEANDSDDGGNIIGGTLITALGTAGYIAYKKKKKK